MSKTPTSTAIPIDQISRSIVIVRGHKVLLDAELAALCGVATKVLIQAVKRNIERFPDDFMLALTADEWQGLRSQFVTSNAPRGGRRYLPYAFTEQGVAMLSSVLNSPHAIAVNIQIMRAFVQLRDLRKSIAQAEAVPVYTVFTNEQLAAMVRARVTTRAGLGKIDGVGEARIEKYGPRVLPVLVAAWGAAGEAGGKPV